MTRLQGVGSTVSHANLRFEQQCWPLTLSFPVARQAGDYTTFLQTAVSQKR